MCRVSWIVAVSWLISALVLGGCAPTCKVFFESEPQGAAVVVKNEYMGRTPIKVPIKVKDESLLVKIDMPGYEPEEVMLTRALEKRQLAYGALAITALGLSHLFVEEKGVVPTAVGAGVGAVFLVFRAASGGMDTYKPSKVKVILQKTGQETQGVNKTTE